MTDTETMRRSLEPFAKMADQVDEWQKGTDPKVNFSFDANDLRRAREAYNRLALPGEQAGTFSIEDAARKHLMDWGCDASPDKIRMLEAFAKIIIAPSPAKPDAEPANHDLLLADAKARQRGENLDGSPRRETIPHDASAGQPDDRFVAGLEAAAKIAESHSPQNWTPEGMRSGIADAIRAAIRALPAPGSELPPKEKNWADQIQHAADRHVLNNTIVPPAETETGGGE